MDEQHASRRERSFAWRAFRITWSLVAGTVFTIGILTAAVTLPPMAVLGLFLAVALPTGAMAWAWSTVNLVPRQQAVLFGVWGGIVMVTAQGLVWLLGGWSLLGLLAVCLSNPTLLEWSVDQVARLRHQRRSGSSEEDTTELVAHELRFDDPYAIRLLDPSCPAARRPGVTGLTTSDLGRLWRVSGSWLDRGLNGAEMAHLVQLRATCLDELERRDPHGFHRWLTADEPCAGEPSQFIVSHDTAPPPDGA